MSNSKPTVLRPGDTIGIAAPASHFDKDEFLKGVQTIENMGFKVYYRPDIFDRKAYLAGSDSRRLDELKELLTNPNIKALFFARGGYGMLRLLPQIKKEWIPKEPKIVLGYSDITSLLLYLMDQHQWVTFYGPVVAKDLGSHLDEFTREKLQTCLLSKQALPSYSSPDLNIIREGTASGILTGGCLSLIVASLGTPFEIHTKGKILFMEDINEKPYAVDRMLTQFKMAGKLDGVQGIICGSFVNGGNTDFIREAIEDVLSDFKGPILFNFPAGHGQSKLTLPLGIQTTLCTKTKAVSFNEAALT